jgi:hypothetical protein
LTNRVLYSEAKSKALDWGDKVDSGIGLSMVNVLEPTVEWTYGEVIIDSGIGSHTKRFSLDSASDVLQLNNGTASSRL